MNFNVIRPVTMAAAFFMGLTFFGSFYIIDEGQRGVIVRTGNVEGIADPGLHFKMPFLISVEEVSLRNQVISYENLQAYTKDLQIATAEGVNITYRIRGDQVAEVYTQYGNVDAVVDRYITRRANALLEQTIGQFTAETSVRERQALSQVYLTALRDLPPEAPIEILSVDITSIAFPEEFNQQVNSRMQAEIAVTELQQKVLQAAEEARIRRHGSDAAAYEITSRATAEAESIRIRGEAEAAAIRARGEALVDSPDLVALTLAEQWNGVLPTTMVPSAGVPFINVP